MTDGDRVAELVGDFCAARERGDDPDPEGLLRAHPECAGELKDALAALGLIELAFARSARSAPERIGPFRIVRELGVGGMGTVYLAEALEPGARYDVGSRVALKVVHAHLLDAPGFFKRFLREAEIGSHIEHENVVRTLDCDAVAGNHYLVMEYVEGRTLAELCDEFDRTPEDLCVHVAREICKALAAIHTAGVVHRDLKPENVLITADHRVRVMDLGIAKLADEQMRLSLSGAFVGSVEYAAPEQFRGGEVDARCDLHALGLVLYELSSGRHPYRAQDFREVMRRVCEEEPTPLGDLNPQLSPFFEQVVLTLLRKNRDERFGSAEELLGVLEAGERSSWWNERALAIRSATHRPLRRVRVPRETAVYGREAELTFLRNHFDQAAEGRGRVVLLEGEAGIGKSRLVDEFVGRLESAGVDVHFLFGSYPPGGAATFAGGLSSAYREQFGGAGSAPYLEQTPVLVPAFDAMLRGEPPPDEAQPLTTDSLATCFVRATRALAAERPTIVLIEDLHFAPQEARDVFASLAYATPGHAVLLIGTMRPGVPEKWTAQMTRLEHVMHTVLPRLGAKDLASLLEDSFQSQRLAEELAFRIGKKSDGNPFFVFEIIRGLREGQFITRRPDGAWVTTRLIEEIEIPSSVLDLVSARVADLDDEDRHLLDAAACWGYEFDASLVGEALGTPRLPVLQRFARIEKRHRLVRSSGRRFVFDHHQVQEALYGALPEMLREEYHSALAEALETRTSATGRDPQTLNGAVCVDLCAHFLKGARGEAALRYLERAQNHLAKGYVHARMVAITERALAVPGLLVGTERAKTLLSICAADGALDRLGWRDRQEEVAREAERLADDEGDDLLRFRVASALGNVFWQTSQIEAAETCAHREMQLARALGDVSAGAAARQHLGTFLSATGRHDEAREHFERVLATYREIGDRRREGAVAGSLGKVLQLQGRFEEAREQFERSAAVGRDLGHRETVLRATGNLGYVFQAQGRLAEARECCDRWLDHTRELGDRRREAGATAQMATILRLEGRLAEAQEHNEQALATSREIGDRRAVARITGNLGNVFLAQGRFEEACDHYERQLALSREIGWPMPEACALLNLGGVLREQRELAASEERLRMSLAVCEQAGMQQLAALAHLALGSLCAAGSPSERERGRESLAAARDLAAKIGAPEIETVARCELALLRGGDVQDALASFAENEHRLDAQDRRAARWLLWNATGDLAHLLEAKRLLDQIVSRVPHDSRQSMLANVRINREIMAAWNERDTARTPD